MSARFFIRNDDVWTLDSRFKFFFEAAIDHGIPVVHAVIPGKMDKGLVRFLCRAKDKNTLLLDIVQHGWMHTNHSTNGKKYEFGAGRSLKLQRQDIQQGLKRMRLAFGENFIPAFVPPYHGYDQRTLRVLDEEGFGIFSAGSHLSPGAQGQFFDIPAQISFSRYEQNHKSIRSAREVLGQLARGMKACVLSGVLMHHADFSSAVSRTELVHFFDLIARLRNRQEARTILFSDFLRT